MARAAQVVSPWVTGQAAVQVADQVAKVPDLLALEELLVTAGLS